MIVQKQRGRTQDGSGAVALDEALAAEARQESEALALLRMQLTMPERSLLNDEIVARVSGMLAHLARQIVITELAASGQRGELRADPARIMRLAAAFEGVSGLLEYCHALALETRLSHQVEATLGVDPVLAPLLQALIGSATPQVAETAMATLTAQARFGQTQARMELPLNELPADLFDAVLSAWKDASQMRGSDTAIRAEARLRNGFDEGRTRLSRLAALTIGLCQPSSPMPDVIEAGVALFFTVLAGRTGQSRTRTVLSSASPRSYRLAVALRAAGLNAGDTLRVLRQLNPQAELINEIAVLDALTARSLLVERSPHRAEV